LGLVKDVQTPAVTFAGLLEAIPMVYA